jgi:cAMP-dependent protein kinase regulator
MVVCFAMTEVKESTDSVRTERNSLDIALEQTLKGQREQPLRWIAAVLEQDPERVMAYYLAGTLLRDSGQMHEAAQAWRIAVHFGIREGSLARSAAAVAELIRIGQTVESEIQVIAETFSVDSPCLLDHGAAPPALVRSRLSVNPAPMNSSEAILLEHVKGVVAECAVQLAQLESTEPLRVPRQALFSALDASGLRSLLRMLELRFVSSGTPIVVQGEPGDEAYVLARGEVVVSRKSETGDVVALARLGSGSLFGEMALLSQSPRTAQVVASRPCILLVLRKDALDDLVADKPELGAAIAAYCRRRMLDNLLRTSAVLRSVHAKERPALVQRFVTCAYESGERIIAQGKEPEGLHLIAAGSVVVVHRESDERTVIATLGVGEVVGEMSLILRRPSGADVVATAPTVTLHLPSEQFLEIVRCYPDLLSHLYQLAVARDAETRSVLISDAECADESVLL